MTDNLTHTLSLIAVLATGAVLIIFGHAYIDPAYVFGTTTTIAGAVFGFKFGVGTGTPAAPVAPVVLPSPSVSPPLSMQDTQKYQAVTPPRLM